MTLNGQSIDVSFDEMPSEELLTLLRENKPAMITYLQGLQAQKEREKTIPCLQRQQAPLSFAQERLWLLHQANPNSAQYNMPSAFFVTGDFNVSAAEEAMRLLIVRHEVLRTNYHQTVGDVATQYNLVQTVNQDYHFSISQEEFCCDEGEDRTQRIMQRIRHHNCKPFDLEKDLMVRAVHISLDPTQDDADAVLLFNMHHIAADGWSMELLVKEFMATYRCVEKRVTPTLETLEIQYSDYALWQREQNQGQQQDSLDYWQKQLQGAPENHNLPVDFSSSERGRHIADVAAASLTKKDVEKLQSLAQKHGMTLFMVLHAAMALTLSCHSNEHDIVVGTPIANRQRPELGEMIGCFVNTLVLRTNTDFPNLDKYLEHVKNVHIQAQSHQDIPFEEVLRCTNTKRSREHNPLVQMLINMEFDTQVEIQLGQAILRKIPDTDKDTLKFDLVLKCKQTESGLSIRWLYNQSMFKSSRFEQINKHFINLLQSFAQHQQTLSSVAMLSDDERRLIENNSNGEVVDYPKTELINTLFEKYACDFPDQIALMFEGESMTYKQLDEKANRLAHWLRDVGVKPGCLVGVHLNRSFSLPLALLAVIKAGGAYVPIDPEYPDSRVEQIVDDTQLRVIISESAHGYAHLDGDMTRIDVDSKAFQQNLKGYPATVPEIVEQQNSSNLIYVMYTSGSTGKPKGVMIEHRSLQCRLYWMQREFQMTPYDSVLQKTPITFDPSMCEIFWTLCYGGTLVLAKPQGHREPVYLSQLMVDQNITITHFVPSMLNAFLENQFSQLAKSVRLVISSGEALLESAVKQAFAQNPTMRFANLYGPTEATIDVAWYECKPDSSGIIPIGKPVFNTELLVLDRQMSLCPLGVIGELYIGGELLARGYWNNQTLTDKAFVKHPYQIGRKLYKTGDLARVDSSGNIEYVGRADQQVKIRGNRIELSEVEFHIGQTPAIESNVVKVFDNNGNLELASFVKCNQTVELADLKQSVIDHLKQKLPSYMIPSHFTQVTEWPMTTSGKIDRKKLHVVTQYQALKAIEKPKNALEQVLHDIWTKELQLEQMSVTDDFFESGGHSISGMRIINVLQQHLNQVIHIIAIFEASSIRKMAEWLKSRYANSLVRQGWLDASELLVQRNDEALKLSDFEQFSKLLPRVKHTGLAQQQIKDKVVFILAPPRSGTTLLRVMLAGHSMLFSPPELELLWFESLGQRAEHFTGRKSFWREGTLEALKHLKQIDGFDAEQLLAQFEHENVSISDFYRNLIDLSNGRILVDKTPTYAYRLSSLEMAEKIFPNAHYIHLVRHPAGMINSFEKASLHQILYLNEHDYSSAKLAELVWYESQKNICQFLANVPQERHLQVHFEDLVSDSDSVMRSICGFLDIEFVNEVLDPYANLNNSMTQGNHSGSRMLGDVKFHQHSKIEKNVASQWRQSMSNEQLNDLTQAMASKLNIADFNATLSSYMVSHETRSAFPALSYAQQRLLFIDSFQNGSAQYNMPVAFDVTGNFNIKVANDTFSAIIQRHEILRTQYHCDGEHYYQKILSDVQFELEVVDLSDEGEVDQRMRVEQLQSEFNAYVFDLTNELMLRGCFIKTSGSESNCSGVLLLNIHHIASDGWSMGIFAKEFAQSYGDLFNGRPVSLTPLAVQYADYANWQRIWLRGENLDNQIAYWKEQLDDLPSVHSLPLDRPRTEVAIATSRVHRTTLGIEQTALLHDFCQHQGATLFMGLHSLLSALLSRHSNEHDIVIGTPVANREQPEITENIGFFVNMLVLRSDLSQQPDFTELLEQSKRVLTQGYAHQQVQFEQLVESLQPERSLLHNPLFQVALVLQPNEETQFELPAASLSVRQTEERFGKYDLTLSVRQTGQSLELSWEFNEQIFDLTTISSLATHFNSLVFNALSSPNQNVFTLPMISEVERSHLLAKNNVQTFVQALCLHRRFEEVVSLNPERIALQSQTTNLTYTQLNQAANQLARYLIEHIGVKQGDLVGLGMTRNENLAIGILAILKAGGAYVPIDPDYPLERISYIQNDANLMIVLSEEVAKDRFAMSNAMRCVSIDEPELATSLAQIDDKNLSNTVVDVAVQSPAYVIYTSGSTGLPKGVLQPHANVGRLFDATAQNFEFTQNDVWTLFHSTTFDFSVWEFWGALLFGGKLLIPSKALTREIAEFATYCDEQGVSVLNMTPGAFYHFSEAAITQNLPLSRLKYVVFGGDKLNLAKLDSWWSWRDSSSPELINMYGITETTVHVTYQKLTADLPKWTSCIGKPISDLKAYILTPQQQLAPTGVTGELYIGGDGLALGYLNRPELNAERFVSLSVAGQPAERLYRTGDLARYLRSGELDYIGRIDHQVKVRGYRIELGEIEQQCLTLSQVKDVVVTLSTNGAEQDGLVAYLVPTSEEWPKATSADAHSQWIAIVRKELQAKLPEHMLPNNYLVLEQLPLTRNGKIDRKNLPEVTRQVNGVRQAPETALEKVLCDVWQDVLGRKNLSVDDNFFTIGGDSIRALSIVGKCKEQGVNFSVRDMFMHPQIATLAEAISAREFEDAHSSETVRFELLKEPEVEALNTEDIEDAYPLTQLQEGMIFHNLTNEGEGLYHDIFSYKIEEKWSEDDFVDALSKLVAKHTMLRTYFMKGTGRKLQVVKKHVPLPLTILDLSHLDEATQQNTVKAWIEEEKGIGFNDEEVLWRVVVHKLNDSTFHYHLSFHHAILDGWSVASFNSELFAIFQNMDVGTTFSMAAQTVPYSDYVKQEIAALGSESSIRYWKDKLVDVDLPWWSDKQGGASIYRDVCIDAERTEALKNIAALLGVQEKSIYLSLHLALLSAMSGQYDVVTSLVTNGRPENDDGSQLLGLFLNSLPARISLKDMAWQDLIFAVEKELTGIIEHRHFPAAEIQHLSNIDLSSSLFNYVHFHVYDQVSDGLNVAESKVFEKNNYQVEITFAKHASPQQVNVDLKMNSDSFTHQDLAQYEQWIGHFVDELIANLNNKAIDYSSLAEHSSGQLLAVNHSHEQTQKMRIFSEKFTSAVSAYPNQKVYFEHSHMTYLQCEQRANQLARYMAENWQVEAGSLVGLLLERNENMLVAMLAVLKLGAAYVPLDPSYPQTRLAFMCEDACLRLVLTEKSVQQQSLLKSVEHCVLDEPAVFDGVARQSDSTFTLDVSFDDLAYVIYTSGSTGNPKGVKVTHANVANFLNAMRSALEIDQSHSVLAVTSTSFDIHVLEILLPLSIGAELVMASHEQARSPQNLMQLIATHRINFMQATPSTYKMLIDAEWSALHPIHALCGGEILGKYLAQQLLAIPSLRLWNMYGPTETTVWSTCTEIISTDKPISIGSPILNTQCYVLSEQQAMLPLGVPGELYIGGAGVSEGYLDRDELTEERFVVNPFGSGRLYRTGDMVKWLPNGELQYLGRLDQQVKVRGHRIELTEIEYALHEHPLVKDAVVNMSADSAGNDQLNAYLVCHSSSDHQGLIRNIKAHLSQSLPTFLLPSGWCLMDAMPLTPNGKVDKKALPKAQSYSEEAYIAPQTQAEQDVCRICAELLNVERVGSGDNFFALGGHSLLAVRLMSGLQHQGYQLDASMILQSATLGALAALLKRDSQGHEFVVPPNLIKAGSEVITPEMLPLV
ncbi:amino acid adenylation domain-containing protein, partial [Alteromonas portus]